MTSRQARTAAVMAGLLALAVHPASAQPQSAPAADDPAVLDQIDQVVTAARVVEFAHRTADPEALRVAARMLEAVPLRASDLGGHVEGGEPSRREDPGAILNAAELRREARALEDADFFRDHEPQQRTPARPPTQAPPPPPPPPPPPVGVRSSPFGAGPIMGRRDVDARGTYRFEIQARAGEILRVAAIGDGDTNIDMVVRDQDGRPVCEDRARDHYPVCTVRPASAGRYRIEIVNHGPIWTRVHILSN